MGLSRHEQMARIRGLNTGPEKLLRSALWTRGLRFRKNPKLAVGRPDVAFVGKKVAVFVDGCFWHGCPNHYVRPRSRSEFWASKLEENVLRDRRQTIELEKLGWRVIRCWEHEVFVDLAGIVTRIQSILDTSESERAIEWRVIRASPLESGSNMEQWELVDLRNESIVQMISRKRDTSKW